jgi:hypothetical protein
VSVAKIVVLLAGPALMVAGWVLLISNIGRGANDSWASGHLVLFAANASWIPATLILYGAAGAGAPRRTWTAAFVGVLIGSLAIAGQLAIDLAAWALALDASALTPFFQAMRSRGVLSVLVYVGGPPLLFAGLVVSWLELGRSRPDYRPWTYVGAGGLGLVLVGALATFSYVILAGYVVSLCGAIGIAREYYQAHATRRSATVISA